LQIVRKIWHSHGVTEPDDKPPEKKPDPKGKPSGINKARAFWLKQLHSGTGSRRVSLIGLIMFAVTGITLNHARQIPRRRVTDDQTASLPAPLLARLAEMPEETTDPVPPPSRAGPQETFKVHIAGQADRNHRRRGLHLPARARRRRLADHRPRHRRGPARTHHARRVAWLNDLHKGRNTGPVWYWFIDVFAAPASSSPSPVSA
jgi:hypothetical protein